MSFLFSLEEDKIAEQLIPVLDKFEKDIADAEPLFKLEGQRIEAIARTLPHYQAFYDQRQVEAKQLVKWLENLMARVEARLTKNYLNGQRVYGSRETSTLIAGEKEIIEYKQLIIEASLVQQKLEAITEAFRQLGWSLGNIVKLRISEMQDAIL